MTDLTNKLGIASTLLRYSLDNVRPRLFQSFFDGGGLTVRSIATMNRTDVGREKAKSPQACTAYGPLDLLESGRRDLNPRPPEPHSGALPGCATSRQTSNCMSDSHLK